jgi:hypothetical protein
MKNRVEELIARKVKEEITKTPIIDPIAESIDKLTAQIYEATSIGSALYSISSELQQINLKLDRIIKHNDIT